MNFYFFFSVVEVALTSYLLHGSQNRSKRRLLLLSLIAKLEKKSPSYSYLLHESSSRGPLTSYLLQDMALARPLTSYLLHRFHKFRPFGEP